MDFLYVEDDEVDARRLSRLLSKQTLIDCRLDRVRCLGESLSLVEAKKYDTIFLDLNLPDGIGVEVVRQMHSKVPETPLILVTGTNDIDLAKQAIQEGAQDYLVKEDINSSMLVKSIHHSIQRQDLVNQLQAARQREHILATHDPLTGLANRALLNQYLASNISRCRRSKCNFAVMFIDLDHFKEINDDHGHAAGDHVLSVVAHRLKTHLRESDFVSRVGGDEFICVTQDMDHLVHIINIAKNLLSTLSKPIHHQYKTFNVSCSIGIAIYPNDASSSDVLIKCADTAMYTAKQNGRNTMSFYDSSLHFHSALCLHAEDNLKQALNQGLLEICYQPAFHSQNNVLRNLQRYQAVLCWRTDGKNELDVSELIKAGQETELCIDIDEYLLRGVVSEYHSWRGSDLEDLIISVNISPRSILHSQFLNMVSTVLGENNCENCAWLEFVIPETIFQDYSRMVNLTMDKLRGLGINLSITGFGKNLAWLKNAGYTALNAIRIDKSYLDAINDEPRKHDVLAAISDFAKHFANEVIFEGVENSSQDEQLNKLQDFTAMGNYYSCPLRPIEMRNILNRD